MLELFVVSGSFLVVYEFEGFVGYPWFFGFRRYLGECVACSCFYGVCDGICLYGGLCVADFDEVKEVRVLSAVE